MPVYRYRFAQVNLTRISRQIPQADVGSLVAGDSAAPLYWDITVNASAKTDLDSYMASLGWEFVSTSPTSTVEEQSASQYEKYGGAGRITPASPISLGGVNQVDVAAGTGRIGYNGTFYDVSWSSTNINTTGYAEGFWYVYVDNTGTVQHSLSVPDEAQNIRLGGFYHDGSQIGDHENDPAIINSFMTRVSDLGRVLGAFISNNAGLVQEMVTDLKVSSPACTVQYGLDEYSLSEVDSDDVGTSFFCWYKSADDGWGTEYFWENFSTGKIPTDRWNDTTKNATTALSANCTFTNGSTTVSTASDLTSEVDAGDVVWLDADGIAEMNRVVSINATTITLEENYGGTGGTGASSVGKALPNLTTSKYVKHLLLRTRSDKMHLILGQEQFDTFDAANDAGAPEIPDAISTGSVKMAFALVQQGDTSLGDGLVDTRPLPFQDTIGGSQGAGVITAHGDLTGLGNDDHTIYHNDTRGDARYYQKTEFLNTSSGAPDAGKPLKLDAGGHVDATMINDGDIDHTQITNIGSNTHAQIDSHISNTSNPHSVTISQVDGSPKIYDAIVAPSGGDYTSIKDAFDAGNNSVFVRTGFYNENATITLPTSGAVLHGEGGAVINLTGTARIEIDGNGGVQETAGTISVLTDSATVTGVGTTFTNLSAGDYIKIGSSFIQIDSITNDTSLELEQPWRGDSQSGITYVAQTMVAGFSLKLMNIIGSGNGCVFIRACRGITIETTVCQESSGGVGLTIEDSYGGHVEQSFFTANIGGGCVITDSHEITIEGSCHFDNNDADGLLINGASTHIIVANSSCTNNDGDGISVEGTSEEISITSMVCDYNNLKGINTEPTTALTTIYGCIAEHNGDVGVDFDGSGNVITACTIGDNTTAGMWAGDDGVVSGCQIENNGGDGITVQGDSNTVIIGNVIRANGADGIDITNTNDVVIIGNHIYDNTVNGISIPATLSSRVHLLNNYVEGNATNYSIVAGAGSATTRWDGRHDGAGITGPVRNFVGTTDPGVGDDIADGFMPGSVWTNTTSDRAWICLDNSSGAAVWSRINSDASVFGSEYSYSASEGESSTTSATYQQKLKHTTPSVPAGDYHIEWYCEVSQSNDDKVIQMRVQLDDTTEVGFAHVEARQKQGDGQWTMLSGSVEVTLTAATHDIDIDYLAGSDTAYIRRARVAIWRVS